MGEIDHINDVMGGSVVKKPPANAKILLNIYQKYSIRGYNENASFMTIREIIIDSFCKNYK